LDEDVRRGIIALAPIRISPFQLHSVVDAIDGYHAVPLDESSQPLTTFITEWGCYMNLRMPQGFIASGDTYTSHAMKTLSKMYHIK